MLFDGWSDLIRMLVVGTLAYAGLVAILRVSGKRTLAKMNAFDLVVTVALGSTFATVLLSNDVSLAEGLLALLLLCLLQYVVAFLSVRSSWFRHVIKSEPALLLRRGEYLRDAMRLERITEDEIRAAARAAGKANLADIEAVILETDGSLSVIAGPQTQPLMLPGVRGGE
jgi:uncharacterized membrane protein YcaP (DUF421 family)